MTIEEMMKMGEIGGIKSVSSNEFWLATAEICKRLDELQKPKIKTYPPEDVAEVRRVTGDSMRECTKVLAFMNGNVHKAIEFLKPRR